MGRLIPAGTGMEFYRNVRVERDETIDQVSRERDLEDFPEIVGGVDVPEAATRTAVAAGGDGDAAAVEEEE